MISAYKLVFYFFYRWFVHKKDLAAHFGANAGLFLVIGIQILMIFAAIQEIAGHNLVPLSGRSYSSRKAFYMLLTFPFFLLFIKLLNKRRVESIISEYEKKEHVFSLKNWILFILMAACPLVIIILLLSN